MNLETEQHPLTRPQNALDAIRCFNCGNRSFVKIIGVRDFEYKVPYEGAPVQCTECQAIRIHPMPTSKDISQFYDKKYHANGPRPLLGATLVHGYEFLKCLHVIWKTRSIKPKKILDVGCGNGEILRMFSMLGKFDLWGIDLELQKPPKGVKIILDRFENVHLPPHSFDIIVLNNILEHVTEPNVFLDKCKSLLRKGGYIFGETPVANKFGQRFFGRYWFGFHFPRHTVLFSEEGLKGVASRSGLKVTRLWSVIHPGTWAIGTQSFLSDTFGGIFAHKGRKLYTYCMMIFFLPLNFLELLFGQGEIVRFFMTHAEDEPA